MKLPFFCHALSCLFCEYSTEGYNQAYVREMVALDMFLRTAIVATILQERVPHKRLSPFCHRVDTFSPFYYNEHDPMLMAKVVGSCA